MSRFVSDQNKVLGIFESGTYASPLRDTVTTGSSFWFGQVTENTIDDDEGTIESRFLGTGNRNFDQLVPGPRNVTGTTEFNPQNMRMLFWAIGSTQSVSGLNSEHSVSEINLDVRQNPYTSGTFNPPISFTLEDSKQSIGVGRNFIREVRGVTPNKVALTMTQSEKAKISMDWIGQTLLFKSGATTTLTEVEGRPYLWNHGTLTINGSIINTVKETVYTIDNSIEPQHYMNGSRDIAVPQVMNRIHTVDVTLDWEGTQSEMLYNEFYKGGSVFNLTLDMNADGVGDAGSQHTILYMSGCFMASTPGIPSPAEGLNEVSLIIRPETVAGSEWSSVNFLEASGIFGPY